jgi:hypothetical protein
MCDVLLPPGVNPTAVKYIYHIISYHNVEISNLSQHVIKHVRGKFIKKQEFGSKVHVKVCTMKNVILGHKMAPQQYAIWGL